VSFPQLFAEGKSLKSMGIAMPQDKYKGRIFKANTEENFSAETNSQQFVFAKILAYMVEHFLCF
jgi:hypothetical protein